MNLPDRTARNHPRRSIRHILTLLLTLGLSLAGLTAVVPATAATDGLGETGHARYEVSADGHVDAEITTTLTNVTADRGNTYYYWDSYSIGVPAGAQDVTATSGGYGLTVRLEDTEDPSTQAARATFSPLRYGNSRTITWTYRIEGAPFRSEQWTRVGPGFATFATQVPGDPERTSLEVVAPKSLRFDASVDFAVERDGKQTVYRLDERTDEFGIWAAVSLRDPTTSDTTTVTVGDHDVTLHAFRGDEEWTRFAAEQITTGVPVLSELLASEWPANVRDVREDASPSVQGYGGWFSGTDREIVVDESLDPTLMLHELTHAWLNHDTVGDRWLVEGLTEVVAQRALTATGQDGETRKAPERQADVAYPLAEWGPSFTLEDDAEAYGYNASYTAAHRITADLDDAAFSQLLADVYAGTSAYAAPDRPRQFRGTTDWRRFVDLLRVHEAEEGAEEILRRWVLTDRGLEKLDDHAAAREVYVALDETDGDWLPPQGLRSTMSLWSFGAAEQAVEELGDAPGLAADVQQAAGAVDLPVPTDVRDAYETANDAEEYADLDATLTHAATAITDVGTASRVAAAERDPVTDLGERLLAVDELAADARAALDDAELDRAQTLAAETTELADRALWVGLAVVLGALLALTLLVAVPWLVVRRVRRRRSRPAVLTAPQVVAVVAAPEADPGDPEPGEVSDDAPAEHHPVS